MAIKKISNKRNYAEAETFTRRLLFERPLLKFVILLIVQFILTNIERFISKNLPIRWSFVFLNILIIVYFIIVIIHFARKSFAYLMNPKNLFYLILAYAGLILIILFIFSTLFSFVDITHLGAIKYGGCSDKFDAEAMNNDPSISKSFFYFSCITFFTVGYGDICPMGFARTLAILAAFVGHIISVILVALILNNYLKRRNLS